MGPIESGDTFQLDIHHEVDLRRATLGVVLAGKMSCVPLRRFCVIFLGQLQGEKI